MESVSSRSWRKLDPSTEKIRLLTLQHGTVDDQPRCDIEVVSLKSDPKYTALSYVWGNENDREDILIQGSKFSVTANLALALRYLQCIDGLSKLWIDAICINQADASEKGQQVSIMADIYSKAHTTYIWLGGPRDHCDEAFANIESLEYLEAEDWSELNNHSDIGYINDVMGLPYWTRIASIPATRFLYVRSKINVDSIMDDPKEPEECGNFPFFDILRLVKENWHNLWKEGCLFIRLNLLLEATTQFSSTLPRDRIFALLGLMSKRDRKYIIPDYSPATSDAQVYAITMAHLLLDLDVLTSLMELDGVRTGKISDLPSWFPDWTGPTDGQFTEIDHSGFDGVHSSLWGSLSTELDSLSVNLWGDPIEFSFSPDFTTLILRALIVDSIHSASSNGSNTIQRNIIEAYEELKRQAFASNLNAYSSPLELSHAFWKSTAFNSWTEGNNTFHEDYFDSYEDRLVGIRTRMPDTHDCFDFEEWKEGVLDHDLYSSSRKRHLWDLDQRMETCALSRRFALTSKGYMGNVPQSSKSGDLICLSRHVPWPFLLRPEVDHYTWVGFAYVHGIMNGEAIKSAKRKDAKIFHVK